MAFKTFSLGLIETHPDGLVHVLLLPHAGKEG